MQHSDFAFANDIRAAVELRTPRTARMLLAATMLLLFTGIVWANFAVLDEVKRGDARVIPSRQIQVIQSLEGGIVDDLLVREGDIVQKGQALVRINDTKFASELGEVKERRSALAARVARLQAELTGQDSVVFPDDLVRSAPSVVENEKSVFLTHKQKIAQDIDVLAQQQTRLSETLKSVDRQVELTKKLYAEKVVPEIEMLKLSQQQSDMRGQLAETQAKIASIKTTFRAQADDDLAKSKADLAVLDENIRSARDRVQRAELRSPVYGIINKLNVTTLGAVIQPAANIMEIVPLDDSLLVEGKIKPQDIAFIRPNQDAVVKITAYDSSVYGSLKGKVERISADAMVDDKTERRPEAYYRVIVRTEKNHLGTTEQPLPIIPGMVATVEVLTGRKSVLDYIMKPARLLRQEALREH
jgi:membrane fusion protein, adhesin transport system